jgi:hypothetical protein
VDVEQRALGDYDRALGLDRLGSYPSGIAENGSQGLPEGSSGEEAA